MPKVRPDLDGVVWVVVDGERMSLAAGDTIPDGVTVGEHITGAQDPEPNTEDDDRPRGNASLDAWQDYARSQGMSDDDLDGLGRDEIRARYQ